MTITVITTVGTSIFENYRQTYLNEDHAIDAAIDSLKDKKANELDYDDVAVVQLIGDEDRPGIQEKFFRGYVIKEDKDWIQIEDRYKLNIDASAEIRSIIKILEQLKLNEKPDVKLKVRLLATDTVLSVLAAKLIKQWFIKARNEYPDIEIIFNDNVHSPEADYIPNLRTDLNENQIFEGFNNLIKKVLKIANGNADKTVINITGGYKGFVPILTIVAQLESIKLDYIYEGSEELIEVPPMPLDFDFSLIEENYLAFETIKPSKIEKNLPLIEDFKNLLAQKNKDYNELLKLKIIEEFDFDGTRKVRLSLIGKLLFNKYEDLYNKNIFSRQNLLGEVVEYKIFEYFIEKEQNAEIYKGKEVGDKGFDIDVFIGRKKDNDDKYKEIEIIEVKPGGNIPIWKKKKDNNSIEYRLTEGSFKWIVENEKADKYIFHLIAYYHTELHPRVIEQIKNLYDQIIFNDKNVELKFTLLSVPENYKNNVNWEVDSSMLKQII